MQTRDATRGREAKLGWLPMGTGGSDRGLN